MMTLLFFLVNYTWVMGHCSCVNSSTSETKQADINHLTGQNRPDPALLSKITLPKLNSLYFLRIYLIHSALPKQEIRRAFFLNGGKMFTYLKYMT